MHYPIASTLVVSLLLLGACSPTTSIDADRVSPAADAMAPLSGDDYGDRIRARLVGEAGNRIGDVIIFQGIDSVVIELSARDLSPGDHGMHLHSVGDCSDTASFQLASGHIAGVDGPHGALHPGGSHDGDLPNLHVNSDGTARVDILTQRVTVADLADRDGAALIIHALPDDYQTQPGGETGKRIACAAFKFRN